MLSAPLLPPPHLPLASIAPLQRLILRLAPQLMPPAPLQPLTPSALPLPMQPALRMAPQALTALRLPPTPLLPLAPPAPEPPGAVDGSSHVCVLQNCSRQLNRA